MADVQGDPRVVIIGGGFGGVGCGQVLDKHDVPTLLVDRNDYHQFQPMLYQLATAQVGATDIAFPLRSIFRPKSSVTVRTADIASIDPAARSCTTVEGVTYSGEVLVIAAGARANFFGVPGAAEHSFPLYSVNDANELRSRVLGALDAVDANPDHLAQGGFTFVVVGGGATGVETAGALSEFLRDVAPHFYPKAPLDQAKVILIDPGSSVLGAFSEQAQHYAAEKLTGLGVELRFGVSVAEVHNDRAVLSDGSTITTRTVIWGAGEQPESIVAGAGLPLGRGGRIEVTRDLAVPDFPGVFAVGDAANVPGNDGEILPQLGSVAQQSGRWAAKNIAATFAGKPTKPFHYHDKGIMAMIGRNAAVAEVGPKRHEVDGVIAFGSWLGVHAMLLSSLKQKVGAFIDWGWDYFSTRRPEYLADRPGAYAIDWGDDTVPDGPPMHPDA